MASKIVTKENLTTNQYKIALENSKTIQYWRANPVIACRDILGITLLDYQAWLLSSTWTAKDSAWVLSRNAGKTTLAGIIILLTALLYPEQQIFLISKTGKQSKLLFNACEKIALNKVSDFGDLPDIFAQEVAKANDSITGFSHATGGFEVTLLNGSKILSLNGIPDNNRGERSTLTVYDESGYVPNAMFEATEPFSTTSKTFQTSSDINFDIRMIPENKPNQRLYISSASDKTTHFYKKVKDLSIRMMAGDKRYFCAFITVDIPLAPTLKGKKYAPLLNYAEVESMMSVAPSKAQREYFCKFDDDGSDDQIIKSYTIDRNSTFVLPELLPEKGARYILGYDSAHRFDNSILGFMKVTKDSKLGYVGDVVNMVNFKDLSDLQGNRQLLFQDQIDEVREYVLRYNGEGAEYENIHRVAIDSGMGGSGGIYGSNLMFDWTDKNGVKHRGMIDKEQTPIEIQRQYPNAYNILNLVEPTRWKSIMVERLIDLMDLGVIRFPIEYNNSGYVDIEGENGEITRKTLSKEEIIALINIDLAKEEMKMIHRFKNGEKVTYKLRLDMQNRMHDDRFFVMALMANELWMLRDSEIKKSNSSSKSKDRTVLKLFN